MNRFRVRREYFVDSEKLLNPRQRIYRLLFFEWA